MITIGQFESHSKVLNDMTREEIQYYMKNIESDTHYLNCYNNDDEKK